MFIIFREAATEKIDKIFLVIINILLSQTCEFWKFFSKMHSSFQKIQSQKRQKSGLFYIDNS